MITLKHGFRYPFLKINDEPLILLNVLERKFILFGVTFWPQDFHLFVLVMITSIVFIFLFTAVFGRLFCGWICPQTIFMEMLFRKIEYLIEGDGRQQRELNKKPWTAGKIVRKGFKHSIFYGLSFLIGNLFLAYVISIDQLWAIITDPPSKHLAGLTAMFFFSGVFYFVFAFFREQVCTLVCPYGRLQSVLLDENSVVISYDFKRGETRGRYWKNQSREDLGDCVDCKQCVVVCPTGIDIRNGTQLECINCTACIDACDSVMDKLVLPRGLVRYDSYNNIQSEQKRLWTPRVLGYSVVLTILVALLVFFLAGRNDIETTILRAPGTLFQEKPGGIISNLYTLKVLNKTHEDIPVEIRLMDPEGTLTMVGNDLVVPAGDHAQAAFFLDIRSRDIQSTKIQVDLGVFSGERKLEEVNTSFMGPEK